MTGLKPFCCSAIAAVNPAMPPPVIAMLPCMSSILMIKWQDDGRRVSAIEPVIYFGLRLEEDRAGGYTYGLAQFNKTEMEVVNSGHSLEEIREFLFNMAHYVLEFDVTFRDGETCGSS